MKSMFHLSAERLLEIMTLASQMTATDLRTTMMLVDSGVTIDKVDDTVDWTINMELLAKVLITHRR